MKLADNETQLQKRSALKLAGRIILGAKRRGKTSVAKFEAQVVMRLKLQKQSVLKFFSRIIQ
jgi:hypothetical protein